MIFLFLKKSKLYVKNKLKYENNIVTDKIILLIFVSNKLSKLSLNKALVFCFCRNNIESIFGYFPYWFLF